MSTVECGRSKASSCWKDIWGKIRNKSSRRKEPMLLCFMAVAWFLITDAPNSQECLGPCKHFALPASCVRDMPTNLLCIPQTLNCTADLQGSVTIGFHGTVSGLGPAQSGEWGLLPGGQVVLHPLCALLAVLTDCWVQRPKERGLDGS